MPKKFPYNIILWGGTGQAKVIRPIVEYYGSKIDAVFNDSIIESPFSDVRLYKGYEGFCEYFSGKQNEEIGFIVTIGNNKTCKNSEARIRIGNMLEEKGLIPVNIIHPSAYIDTDVKLGKGIQICAGAIIITKTQIEDYCIINTGASVDHECYLGKGVEIGPHATLCGLVNVREKSWIGANATILPRLEIGKNSVVGAGSVVTKNVLENLIVAGNPAKELYTKKEYNNL